MQISLLVIRTKDTRTLADFYSLLGMNFEYHQHGNAPYHFSSAINKTVIEIYPLSKDQHDADKNLRLGFTIDDFDAVLKNLKDKQIQTTAPLQTDFGFLTIITDPDGRKIELYKK